MTSVQDMIDRGAMFVVNHSGGKDSQAMLIHLRERIPAAQLVIVHADLAEVEWAGAVDHINATRGEIPLHITKARDKAGQPKTLLEMVARRGMFPSPTLRQCTSDLKRGPIERKVRELVQARKARGERGWYLVVNCMGMRAQESSARSKLETWEQNDGNSLAGRIWFDWLPIHDWTESQVFATIRCAGQEPHPVYARGMTRFSCAFCIMASEHDLKTAARLSVEAPELFNDRQLYRKYVELERSTGQVMLMPDKTRGRRSLEQVTGVYID